MVSVVVNKNARKRIHSILETAPYKSGLAFSINIGLITLITLNIVATILGTVHDINVEYGAILHIFEAVSVFIFSVEYLLRTWSCVEKPIYSGSFRGRLKFVRSPMAMIDLIAILPFYLQFFISFDLITLRAFRLVRIFRIFKLSRYASSMRTMGNVFRQCKEELVITIFIVSILLVVASSFMYLAERQAQPDVFSSIPATMWWGVATLTTVGYGDIYPVTVVGKVIAGIIAVLGVGMFALPAGILGSGLVDQLQRRKQKKRSCPHCGEEITDGN